MAGPPPAAGERIGKLRLLRPLGEGGMGVVFEAVHEQIGQRVAVKVLRPEVSAQPGMAQRFLNEARAVSLIRHPGVVYVSEFGTLDSGVTYLVMELLEGESLKARLRARAPLGPAEALRLGRQIAAALAAAHARGVVHRDLKPANVMVVADSDVPGGERAKILDFGIAKLRLPEEAAAEAPQVQTHSQAVFGTPAYMAPEQCRGARDVDDRVDVYALGVMLYEMLSGGLPLWARSATELMYQQIHTEPLHLREVTPQVPAEVAELVHRMLAKDPAARPSMAEAAAALERHLDGAPATPAPRPAATEDASIALDPTSPRGQAPAAAAPPPPPRRGAARAIAAAAALLLALGVALFLQSARDRHAQETPRPRADERDRPPAAAAAVAPAPAPPATASGASGLSTSAAAAPAPAALPAPDLAPLAPAPAAPRPPAPARTRPAEKKDDHEPKLPDRRPLRRPPPRPGAAGLRNEDIPLDPLP